MMLKFSHIDAKALKNLIDTDAPVILDARSKKWDDGRRIPGARRVTAEALLEDYTDVILDKGALVVVYCGGRECPAGGKLVDNLVKAGYTNVVEYADDNQYPIEISNEEKMTNE